MRTVISSGGYTLIEIVVVFVIIGLLITVAAIPLQHIADRRRLEETMNEMQHLADALAGDRYLRSGGLRTDFGYIGDVGSLPATWEDLVTNPGLATWKGPYIHDRFLTGFFQNDYRTDAWGAEYSLPNNHTFSSTGGPGTLTIRLANSIDDLLHNRVYIAVTNRQNMPPGVKYNDSVLVQLSYPNGTGTVSNTVKNPDPDGLVVFDSVPIGLHNLKIIFNHTSDTVFRKINIEPGLDYYDEVNHFAKIW